MNNDTNQSSPDTLPRTLGTWQVMTAGVALVVAASTLVTDFTGFFTLGGAFVIALLLGFLVNLLLAVSAAEAKPADLIYRQPFARTDKTAPGAEPSFDFRMF